MALRVITQRLSATPTKQLPLVARYLAADLAECRNLLQSEDSGNGRPETTVLVNKLKTQLSTLLHDRAPEARYVAILMLKALIENGGWKVLQTSGPWVRWLIAILGRPDPPSVKKLCIITVTRIFVLTHNYQSLVREITTPSLSAFITACLNLVKAPTCNDQIVLTVLQALKRLIMLHPASFRPYVSQMKALVVPYLAPTPSSSNSMNLSNSSTNLITDHARRLFVSLHVCGPKNTAAEEWSRSMQDTLDSAHRTTDRVFRALIEDWRPSSEGFSGAHESSLGDVVADQTPEPLPLPSWTGIYAGIERLDGLLQLIQTFIASKTSAAIAIPLGGILTLMDRMLSAFAPSIERRAKVRPEIDRDEREGLWIGLQKLHASAIEVLSMTLSRLGTRCHALSDFILEQVLWVLETERHSQTVRERCYGVITKIIAARGFSLPQSRARSITRCLKLCCEDILPIQEPSSQMTVGTDSSFLKANGETAASVNADLYLKTSKSIATRSSMQTDGSSAAGTLLKVALINLPNGFLSKAAQSQINRTAILIGSRSLMMASVISTTEGNSQQPANSILPMLVRAHPDAMEVEMLLRPRMPLIQDRRRYEEQASEDSGDDGSGDMHEIDAGFIQNGPSNGTIDLEGQDLTGVRNEEPIPDGIQLEVELNTPEKDKSRNEPSNFQSTFTSSAEPQYTVSYSTAKRDREEDSDHGGHSELEQSMNENMIPVEAEPLSKRTRVTPNISGPDPQAVPGVEDKPTASTLDPNAAHAADRASYQGLEDSDESDFEMPTLDLGPLTDEEDEEEDDQ